MAAGSVVTVTLVGLPAAGAGGGGSFAGSGAFLPIAGLADSDGRYPLTMPNVPAIRTTPAAISFHGMGRWLSWNELNGSYDPIAEIDSGSCRLSARAGAAASAGGSSFRRMLVWDGLSSTLIVVGALEATGAISIAGGGASSGVHDSVSADGV